MARYFLQISYDGTAYHGWQRQSNSHTVQAEIESCLTKIGLEHEGIMGCGRTDAGVHASEFFAHVNLDSEKIDNDIVFKLNAVLPHDIAIHQLTPLHEEAHARFDASARSYTYLIHHEKDPFLNERSYLQWRRLDIDRMNKACSYLIGTHEFTSFAKLHGGNNTDLCDVRSAEWSSQGHRSEFHITADRFLRNMVRAIVGTLIEVGQGKIDPTEVKDILKAKDRGSAGASAPAHGLYLSRVEYPYLDRYGE